MDGTAPFFDDVEYIGASKLRTLNSKNLRALRRPLVIMPHYREKGTQPLAVIINYQQYLALQSLVMKSLEAEAAELVKRSPKSNIGQ